MDTTSEYQDSAPAPMSPADKIRHVAQLIGEQQDDEPGKGEGAAAGSELEAEAVRGDDGGSREMDTPKPDPDAGVPDDPEDAEATIDEGAEAAVSVAALAEKLGVEPADVYELEVPMKDGGTITLGQLKDEFSEYGPAKEFQSKLREDRDKFERMALATRSELSAIMHVIPKEMQQAMVQAGRQHQQQWAQEQETAVLEAIPEWADADQRAKDRAMLVADGAEYGFSEQEITYTQDARTLRMLRDFSRMRRELQEMRAAAKAQPGVANPPGKRPPATTNRKRLQQALARAKADPTIQGKAAVVSQLIRNQ